MKPNTKLPPADFSIYKYTSYREFLHDYYVNQKRLYPHFSYQYFANKAGFKTKTFIYKVIKGKKDLAKRSILKIAKAMGLKKRETDYFEAMVDFNNAVGMDEKEHYFHRLLLLCKNHSARIIRKNQFDYFNHWYIAVIRELVTILDWKGDYTILAKAVNPPITTKKARNAVKLLTELGMIKKLAPGEYIQTHKAITTGDLLVKSLAVQKFQKQYTQLASEAIERHKKNIRDVSTLTVGISETGFNIIRKEIKSFRENIVEIVSKDEHADRVYHINFQLFPVSELPKKKKIVKR